MAGAGRYRHVRRPHDWLTALRSLLPRLLSLLTLHKDLMRSHGMSAKAMERQTLPHIRKLFKQMVRTFHPPVSKLNAKQVIEYCYATADSLGWSLVVAVIIANG